MCFAKPLEAGLCRTQSRPTEAVLLMSSSINFIPSEYDPKKSSQLQKPETVSKYQIKKPRLSKMSRASAYEAALSTISHLPVLR